MEKAIYKYEGSKVDLKNRKVQSWLRRFSYIK